MGSRNSGRCGGWKVKNTKRNSRRQSKRIPDQRRNMLWPWLRPIQRKEYTQAADAAAIKIRILTREGNVPTVPLRV